MLLGQPPWGPGKECWMDVRKIGRRLIPIVKLIIAL